jgi:hypothetical protein
LPAHYDLSMSIIAYSCAARAVFLLDMFSAFPLG